ncbi:MAG TPA: hypothetical protein VF544_14135 [Pyrinomonadaceae bacterium]|jgi:hypothetical protein
MVSTFGIMVRALTACFFVCLLAAVVQAQRSGRSGSSSSPTPTREAAMMGDLEREFNQRTLEDQLHKPTGRREQKLSFAQISEDFLRIQVINNELVTAAARAEELDLKFVAKSTAEIRKLAGRLKENLVLPEPTAGPKRLQTESAPEELAQLKPALAALGKLIAGFAHNPVFKEPKVVDAQMSAKARRDLEEIIELSGQLRKSSEKLTKTARKSP